MPFVTNEPISLLSINGKQYDVIYMLLIEGEDFDNITGNEEAIYSRKIRVRVTLSGAYLS